MAAKVTNNAYGTLSASITNTATTLTLNSGEGARFPALGAGDYFYATLVDTSNNLEIVKVTARSVDSMTIVRAQDGTTAKSYALNDRLELRPVAALFNEKVDLETVTTVARGGTGKNTLTTNSLLVGNGTTAIGEIAPGTSGNILRSSGTTWSSQPFPEINTDSYTLLGTVAASSGNSVSLSELDLTEYKTLLVTYVDIRCSASGWAFYISSNNANTESYQGGQLLGTAGASGATPGRAGSVQIELLYGNVVGKLGAAGVEVRTNITNSTTTIYFRLASGNYNLSGGKFTIYGVK
jgi:hypothetical protein